MKILNRMGATGRTPIRVMDISMRSTTKFHGSGNISAWMKNAATKQETKPKPTSHHPCVGDPADLAPVPFIQVVDGKYKVGEKAVDFFNTISEPVSPVVVVGKYRTGKSLLINRCMLSGEKGSKFGVGNTVNSCTKGIWVYPKVLHENGQSIVVMDSEGIGSLDADSTHDTKIFALALLLSSQFVYNSVISIDESAISTLSLVLRVSQQIQMNAEDSIEALMPRFTWVVRDFTLLLTDTKDAPITANQYLENAISPTGDPDRDQVRDAIRSCFPDRECFPIVRPCTEEADMRQMDRLPDSALRPEFVSQLKELRGSLWRSIRPKRMLGETVTGRMLVELAGSLCGAINTGAAPVIRDSWALMCEVKNRDLMSECVARFREEVWEWSSSSVLPRIMEEDLEGARHRMAADFRQRCASVQDTQELMRRLEDQLVEISKSVAKKVRQNFENALHSSVDKLGATVAEWIGESGDWGKLQVELASCETRLKQVVGDEEEAVAMLRARLYPMVVEKWGPQCRGSGQLRELKAKLLELEGERERVAKGKEENEARLKKERVDHEKGVEEMCERHKQAMREKSDALDSSMSKYSDLYGEVGEAQLKVSQLEERLDLANSTIKHLEEKMDAQVDDETSMKQLEQSEAMVQELRKLKDKNTEMIEEVARREEMMRQEERLHQAAVEDLSGALAEARRENESVAEGLRAEVSEERDSHESTRVATTATISSMEKRLEKMGGDLSRAENLLAAERKSFTQMVEQAESNRDEMSRLLSESQVRARSVEVEHQCAVGKQADAHSLVVMELNQSIRTLEGEVGQLRERLVNSKRQLEGADNDAREAKRVRTEYSKCQKENIKVSTEADFLRMDKAERSRDISEERTKMAHLTQRNMELEKRLAVELAKNGSNAMDTK